MRPALAAAVALSAFAALAEGPGDPAGTTRPDVGAPPEAEAEPTGVLTRAPELLVFVPAEYPPDAASAGVSGTVELALVIDELGEVVQAVVLDPGPHPAFAPAALHAVTTFRFRAAEIDGVPAAVEITYRYAFTLRRALAASDAPADAPVVLAGRLLERGTRRPVAGARVEAGASSVETDAQGRFGLRGLPPGPVLVRVLSADHEPLDVPEVVEPGRAREVEYRLARRSSDPYAAVVRGERARREISIHELAMEEVRTVAGTQGDTLKVVQNLPGVARSPFGVGLLVVRGSDPDDTTVLLDGIPVPQLFHFGGLTSVVSSDVIESLEFYPGNFSARHGRAIGGAVELRTRDARRESHGLAQLDVFDGRVQVEGPLGEGSAFAAVRRSWVDAVLAVALPRVAPDAANELRVAPRYYDYQAKVSHPLAGGTASLVGYGSDDAMTYVEDGESSGRPTFYLRTLFHRVAARWRGVTGPLAHDLTVAVGRDSFDVLQSDDFGVLTEVRALSVRDATVWRPSPRFALEAGVDALLRRFSYEVYAPPLAAPGRFGSPVANVPLTVGERDGGTWLAPGAYLEADWRALPPLRIVAGLRLDGDSRLRDAPVWLDPRLSVFWDVGERTTLHAAAGLHGSAPAAEDMTESFGNEDLGRQRALHLSAGVRQRLPWEIGLEVTGFHKEMWDLVTATRATRDDGRLAHLSNEGRGRATGLEVLLRRDFTRGLYGWVAYTLSRSMRRDDPTMSGAPEWHPFVLDQTHVLTTVLSWRLAKGWIVGARARAVSGNPFTPTQGAVLDANSGRYRCIPGPTPYGDRMPGFFQADVRVDKRFAFRRWALSVYLDAQNVTNRENAEYWFPSYDCSEQVPIPSVPFLPTFGVRGEW